MGLDPHERARFLVSEARITGLSGPDALWLRGHVAECAACAGYEQEMDGVVRGLRAFAFEVDPGVNDRIYAAITRKQRPALRWAWAAAAILVVAAVPVYRGARDAQRDHADAVLMEAVENRVGRVVPVAMEPLVQGQPEESK